MAETAASKPMNTVTVDIEAVAEDTPLLGEIQPQERTGRSPSVAGKTDYGYQTIPATIAGQLNASPEYEFWQVIGILSVLLIGKSIHPHM